MNRDETTEDPSATTPVTGHVELARPQDVLPGLLHILPLANRPFFPAQAIPLVVEKEPWARTIEAAMETPQKAVGLVLVRGDDPNAAGPDDFYPMGTVCRIHRVAEHEDKLQVLVEGLQRFRIEDWVSRARPFVARVEYFPETGYAQVAELKAYSVEKS